MLVYRRTSIMESTAQTIVNTVNCVGVMGKGLAKEFKDLEPEMFAAYKSICDRGLLEPGKLWLWRGEDRWVLNFPTKIHWRNPSKLEWIESGLKKFLSGYERLGIREISFPRLGCGNGGLDWDDVRPVMEHYLRDIPIKVFIHDYSVDIGLPEHLEIIAQSFSKKPAMRSFDDFMLSLNEFVVLSGGIAQDIESDAWFNVSISDDEGLSITENDVTWEFDAEMLWSVWISLQKGLMTRRRLEWATSDGGSRLLSVLSTLPGTRPIEVQEAEGTKQLAVEYAARGKSTEQIHSKGQISLSWH